jgi:hypothetical protein
MALDELFEPAQDPTTLQPERDSSWCDAWGDDAQHPPDDGEEM